MHARHRLNEGKIDSNSLDSIRPPNGEDNYEFV